VRIQSVKAFRLTITKVLVCSVSGIMDGVKPRIGGCLKVSNTLSVIKKAAKGDREAAEQFVKAYEKFMESFGEQKKAN